MLAALDQPAELGYQTRGELLAALAQQRNQTPRGLQRMLDAARFLLSNYPAEVQQYGVAGGFSLVDILARHHRIDAAEARAMLLPVLRDEATTADVRKAYENALGRARQSAPTTVARSIAKSRAMAFERLCMDLVTQDPARFCGMKGDLAVVRNFRDGVLAVDAAIFVNGRAHTVVEAKVPGIATTSRDVVPVLAQASLLLRRYKKVWFLMPEGARAHVEELKSLAMNFNLDGFIVVAIDEAKREIAS